VFSEPPLQDKAKKSHVDAVTILVLYPVVTLFAAILL
jgi:hypothetical protein